MLENRRKKSKEMDVSKKKQMLNRKAVKSRKRKISKLHVDVCIMESRIPLGPGKFRVVVLVGYFKTRNPRMFFQDVTRSLTVI